MLQEAGLPLSQTMGLTARGRLTELDARKEPLELVSELPEMARCFLGCELCGVPTNPQGDSQKPVNRISMEQTWTWHFHLDCDASPPTP